MRGALFLAGRVRYAARVMNKSRWLAIAVAATVAWLALMVLASYLSYEHRLPVRIPNWQPDKSR